MQEGDGHRARYHRRVARPPRRAEPGRGWYIGSWDIGGRVEAGERRHARCGAVAMASQQDTHGPRQGRAHKEGTLPWTR